MGLHGSLRDCESPLRAPVRRSSFSGAVILNRRSCAGFPNHSVSSGGLHSHNAACSLRRYGSNQYAKVGKSPCWAYMVFESYFISGS